MSERLADESFMRAKLFDGSKSNFQRYKDMVVGAEASFLEFLRYELTTTLLGRMSGALGIVLRKIFYPRLFGKVGRGVIFGRDLIIRHGRNVELGDQVVLDDGCFIDGRGAGPGGIRLGDRVVVGRGSIIQAKIGTIRIGDDTDIGSGSVIVAQGGVEIGRAVVLGGNVKVSGGVFRVDRSKLQGQIRPGSGPSERGQTRWTAGPITIADRAMLGMNAIILDGVHIGEMAVIGAGTVVTRDLASKAIAAGVPARVLHLEPEESAQDAGLETLVTFRSGKI
jgi:acetyltransferase-like isoleucine patch superfamily enzyme